VGASRWDVFERLDSTFEQIAAEIGRADSTKYVRANSYRAVVIPEIRGEQFRQCEIPYGPNLPIGGLFRQFGFTFPDSRLLSNLKVWNQPL
jgi:hypothetical protein